MPCHFYFIYEKELLAWDGKMSGQKKVSETGICIDKSHSEKIVLYANKK